MSERLKLFALTMDSLCHSFRVADAYIKHNRLSQARKSIEVAQTRLKEGSEICKDMFGTALGEDFAYAMDMYYQLRLKEIPPKLN